MDEATRKMIQTHLSRKGFTQQAADKGIVLAEAAIRSKFPNKGGN